MSIVSRLVAVCLLASTPLSAAAVWERVITPAAPGMNRVTPDAPLLVHAKPLIYNGGSYTGGLEDLRLYDRDGREVPYVVLPPVSPSYTWRSGSVLPVASTKTTSGFEIDLGRVANIDRIRFEGLPRPVMKRAAIEGSGDRTRWALLANATIFDLPDESLKQTEYPFAPGAFRYIRVTWDDRSSARVGTPPTVSLRTAAALTPQPQMVQLPFERQPAQRGESHFRIQLPGRSLPIVAIHIQTSEVNLFRTASVTEARFTGTEVMPFELGSATLKKKSVGDVSAAELRIPTQRPASSLLDLTVEDGSNPPLKLQTVMAELAPLPTIYFESADMLPVVARFGDPSLTTAPRYDLEALRGELGNRPAAAATWGLLRTTVEQPKAATISPAGSAGGAIDPSQFSYNRKLGAAPRGFSSVQLDADVLAKSREDLTDVRIVSGDKKQIPYIVERKLVPLTLPLKIVEEKSDMAGVSRYRIDLPYDRLPGATIALTTDTPLFQRKVTIESVDSRRRDESQVIESKEWTRTDADAPPATLTADLPHSGIRHLRISIEEGDNAPLHVSQAQLLLPGLALRFFHPGGELELLYGNPKATSRQYDLALLGPALYDKAAHEVPLGPPATGASATDWFLRIFWIVLAVAVAGMLFILVRLLMLPVPYELRSGPTADKLYKNNREKAKKFE